jgi:predicted alpha-1,2-mannosidase
LGGIQNLSDLLDTLFTLPLPYENYSQSEDIESVGVIGNYVHGNEPGHHIPYLYNYTGEPWKSQAKIRQIMQKMYHPTPEGLCGNDDCGQMSAWYIFSAMGFYPVTPGTDQYVLGSPNIQKATIHLRDNKKFTIEVKNQSQENIYVQRVLYNDKEWHQSFITHEMLTQGGQIIFEMGNKINSKRGATPSGRPYSLSNEH